MASVTAGHDRGRDERLHFVAAQLRVGRCDARPAEVDEAEPAVVIDDQMGFVDLAVGDPVAVEVLDEFPQFADPRQRVGHRRTARPRRLRRDRPVSPGRRACRSGGARAGRRRSASIRRSPPDRSARRPGRPATSGMLRAPPGADVRNRPVIPHGATRSCAARSTGARRRTRRARRPSRAVRRRPPRSRRRRTGLRAGGPRRRVRWSTTPIWPSPNRTSSRLGRPALEPTRGGPPRRPPPRTGSRRAHRSGCSRRRAIVAIDPSSRTQWPEATGGADEVRRRGDDRRARHGEPSGGEDGRRRRCKSSTSQHSGQPPPTVRPRSNQADHAHDHRQHHVPGDRSAMADERADEHDHRPDHRQVGHRLPRRPRACAGSAAKKSLSAFEIPGSGSASSAT